MRWSLWLISYWDLCVSQQGNCSFLLCWLLCGLIAVFILLFWQIWRFRSFPKGWAHRGWTCVFLSLSKKSRCRLNLRVTGALITNGGSGKILYEGFSKHRRWLWASGSLINFLNHHCRYFCLSEVWSTKWQLQVGNDLISIACSNPDIYLLLLHPFYETLDIGIPWLICCILTL